MPDPSIGILAGGQLLGAGLSYKGAKEANKAADRREQAALAFEQKKYDDWKAVYGPIEQNLSEYYKTLSPSAYAVKGLEAFNKQKEEALVKIRENFERRGIRLDSSLAVATEAAVELEGAKQEAFIRVNAEDEVRKQKQGFLSIGLQNDPTESMSRTLGDLAANARSRADEADIAASKAIQGAITSTTTALSDYYKED